MEKTKEIMAIAKEYYEVCIYTEENDESISGEEWDEISDKLEDLENSYYEASVRYHLEKQGIENSEVEKYIERGYKKREYMEELIEIYENNYSPTR